MHGFVGVSQNKRTYPHLWNIQTAAVLQGVFVAVASEAFGPPTETEPAESKFAKRFKGARLCQGEASTKHVCLGEMLAFRPAYFCEFEILFKPDFETKKMNNYVQYFKVLDILCSFSIFGHVSGGVSSFYATLGTE